MVKKSNFQSIYLLLLTGKMHCSEIMQTQWRRVSRWFISYNHPHENVKHIEMFAVFSRPTLLSIVRLCKNSINTNSKKTLDGESSAFSCIISLTISMSGQYAPFWIENSQKYVYLFFCAYISLWALMHTTHVINLKFTLWNMRQLVYTLMIPKFIYQKTQKICF